MPSCESPEEVQAAEALVMLAKEAVVHEKKEEVVKSADSQRYCYCNGPDVGDMVQCDGRRCARGWFHFKCLGITTAPRTKKWYCEDCQLLG